MILGFIGRRCAYKRRPCTLMKLSPANCLLVGSKLVVIIPPDRLCAVLHVGRGVLAIQLSSDDAN